MRRALAFAAAAALIATAYATPAVASNSGRADRVVVVGVPNLAWHHVTREGTPRLWELAAEGSVASLSVRAATPVTRRYDGWVTLSAGNRARARTESLPPVQSGIDPAVALLDADNDTLTFDATIGAFGDALADAGISRQAVGRGGQLAVADSAGQLPDGPLDAAQVAVHEVLGIYSDAPTVADLAAVDAEIGTLATRAGSATLLVLGVSTGPQTPPGLQVAIARGQGFDGGLLTSASTRRAGFVQLIDIAPTVLDLLGAQRPGTMVGQPVRRTGGRRVDEIAHRVDVARAADAHRRYVPPFFTLVVAAQLLLYGVAWWQLRRRRDDARSRRVRVATRHGALAFASVPAALYLIQLVPWWRHRAWYLLAAVAAATALVYLLAVTGPWRRSVLGPPGAIAAITASLLAVDLVTGARLQMSSLAGYSPIVAGRFAGVGNVAFAVFATSALLATAAICVGRSRRTCVIVTALVGLATVVIDGSPVWGSDFGGVLALVPGFAVLGMLLVGARLSWRRMLVIALASLALVTAFALMDYARPEESRTHLGRFVGQIVDGGAGTVIQRKAEANLRLLTHSVLTLVVPVAVGFLGFVLLRPWGGLRTALEHTPPLRAGLVSVLVMAVVGFLANDSGVAVPSFALTLAVPIALAASLRTSELLRGPDD